jgi:hypothetical protein
MATRTHVCMKGRKHRDAGVAALVVVDLELQPQITER